MIGRDIGAYRVVRQIGEGGMSAVFEAVHNAIPQRAAVKVLSAQVSAGSDALRRFLNEAHALSVVQQPGLVKLFDFGQLPDGTAYILMEFLEGESLGARLRRTGALPLPEALRLSRQIARTLTTTHRHGIVHRDLKPDNVYIIPDPESSGGERAKVLDFGIAKLLGSAPASEHPSLMRQTVAGLILGTPEYIAPEQCHNEEITAKADVYALGVILHEMVAGALPFQGKNARELLMMHMLKAPPPLTEVAPGTPPGLSELVLRMLAKDPTARPPMDEVAAQIIRLGGERVPSGSMIAVSSDPRLSLARPGSQPGPQSGPQNRAPSGPQPGPQSGSQRRAPSGPQLGPQSGPQSGSPSGPLAAPTPAPRRQRALVLGAGAGLLLGGLLWWLGGRGGPAEIAAVPKIAGTAPPAPPSALAGAAAAARTAAVAETPTLAATPAPEAVTPRGGIPPLRVDGVPPVPMVRSAAPRPPGGRGTVAGSRRGQPPRGSRKSKLGELPD